MNILMQSPGGMLRLALLACLALAPAACAGPHIETVQELMEEKKALDCRMEYLKRQSDSLWDEVAASLERSLPADMKADERKNMISLRNAALISMFQSFPSLDTAIQAKVIQAGEQDKMIASEMRSVMEHLAANEQGLATALAQLQNSEPAKYKQARRRLLEMEKAPCD